MGNLGLENTAQTKILVLTISIKLLFFILHQTGLPGATLNTRKVPHSLPKFQTIPY